MTAFAWIYQANPEDRRFCLKPVFYQIIVQILTTPSNFSSHPQFHISDSTSNRLSLFSVYLHMVQSGSGGKPLHLTGLCPVLQVP